MDSTMNAMEVATLHADGLSVNLRRLPSRVLSFCRWLHRWYRQTGDVHPSTKYLARKQGVTERTIYRWLRQLREAGYIVCDVLIGVERQIEPANPLPKRARVSGVRQSSCQGSYDSTQYTQDTTPSSPDPQQQHEPDPKTAVVVQELQSHGVSRPVALQLAAVPGPEECRRQMEVLPLRKPEDPAAMLVKAIREAWSLPRGAKEGREAPMHPASRPVQAPRTEKGGIIPASWKEAPSGVFDAVGKLPGFRLRGADG
jgi:Helix-turn-helix domain